jgi:phosphoglycerate dehydrogenase-like enzyme
MKPSPLSSALSGKTVCIVGMGSIGQKLIDRLRPFGVRMAATDEHPERAPGDVTAFPADQLKTAVAHAYYVVLCLRASEENKNLLNGTVIFISRVVEEFAAGKKPNSVLNSPQKPRRALRG